MKNELIIGDCLEVMRSMDGEIVDLIYADPPFNSGHRYNGTPGSSRPME